MPDTIPGHPHTNAGTAAHSGAVHRGWFQHLQALEDAIAYRRARVSALCPDCTASGQTCDDHACDLNLIAEYQQTATAAIQEASSQTPGTPVPAPAAPAPNRETRALAWDQHATATSPAG
jgi:hypothetical protein